MDTSTQLVNSPHQFGLSPGARARLSALIQEHGGISAIARATGMPRQTISKILREGTDVGATRLALMASVLGVTVDYILHGRSPGAPSDDYVGVPIHDLTVAAGGGSIEFPETRTGAEIVFVGEWLRAKFGSVSGLRIISVTGDSQEPTLRAGDHLMIDVRRRELAEGLYVLRLDGGLIVKRMEPRGDFTHLYSANPAYPEIIVDMRDGSRDFAVIGRAVWMGRLLV